LRTIYQSISLADDLEIAICRSNAIGLELLGFPVPGGEQNLAVRAARAMQKKLRLRGGLRIRLNKRIPPGSGLGGASSDAAAMLRGVLALSGKRVAAEEMLHLAAELGSDVPFFLTGGRAVGVGRGEEIYPLPDLPRCSVVIVFPGEGMSTAEAYRLIDEERTTPQPSQLTASHAQPTIELFCGRVFQGELAAYGNDFEPLLFQRMPRLRSAKKSLLQNDAVHSSLTGSGSALYGLFQNPVLARRAAQLVQEPRFRVFVSHTVSRRQFAPAAAFVQHASSHS
jgi:4-diphosphocytidyl-2-C-methyl-D-erythritol kinase